MTRIIAAMVAACLWTIPAYGDCAQADKTLLQQLDERWGVANRSGDRAVLDQVLADDYMAISLVGVTPKAQAIANAVKAAEANRASQTPAEGHEDYYQIVCTATTGTITHRLVTTVGHGADQRVTYSRSIHVVEKRGGRWQVVSNATHALNDSAVLAYIEQEWNDATRTHDPRWFERNLAADYSGISGTNETRTKAQEVGFARTNQRTFASLELSELAARIVGDMAIVTGVNTIKGKEADGKPLDYSVRFTDVFVRRDGRWQVLGTHGSILPKKSTT